MLVGREDRDVLWSVTFPGARELFPTAPHGAWRRFDDRASTVPNESHHEPLTGGSCNPPAPESSWLTVGTRDANGLDPASAGFVKATMCATGTTASGPCSTPAGMSAPDVRLETNVTDVRCKVGSPGQSSCEGGALSDYLGELETVLKIRMTDKSSGPSGGPYTNAATVEEITFSYTVPCQVDPAAVGGTCSVVTRANGLVPGAATSVQNQDGLGNTDEIDRCT
jgi:hypothetical protein